MYCVARQNKLETPRDKDEFNKREIREYDGWVNDPDTMTRMYCVARQNKLETPRDKDEVNKREIREYDGWVNDPDTMIAPLTPNPTRKTETLVRTPSTIVSRREEDAALKEVVLPKYRCVNCILETKTKVG